MNQNQNMDKYQIKVNRLFLEKEKSIPYSKYIKNDYPQLSKVVPKHSILYKAKHRPEIVINKFHHTSNNFNTNINIKTSPSENLDTYNFNNKLNNEIRKTFENNNYINYNNINYYTEQPFKNINYNHRTHLSENFNNENKLIDFILQSRNNSKEPKANNFNNNINDTKSSLDSKYSNKTIEVKRKNNNEIKIPKIFNTTKYNKYNKHKNLSLNLIDQYNKVINREAFETSIESLSNKSNKTNNIILSSGKKMNNDFGNKIKMNFNRNINDENTKDLATIKMEIYRIKLFKEFFKHFKKYYQNYIKIYYYYFLNKLKNEKYYKKIMTNSKTIDNYYPHHKNSFNLLRKNKTNINIIDNMKSSSIIKDYNRIYNKIKKININSNFNNNILKNKNPISYDFNKIDNNNNKNLPIFSHIRNFRNITPRINKNLFDLSLNNKRKECNSPSPSFRFGNKIIINRDISFGKENKDENELFRDSKELNKKYEQIQRRKRKIPFINNTTEMLNNKSLENCTNSKNNIYNLSNELDEIKKYFQNKKNYHTLNTVDAKKNKSKSTTFIKIINGEEENKINNNDLKDTELNNNNNKIMKVNINKNLLNNYGKRIISKDINNKIIPNYSNYKNNTNYNKNNIFYSKKINKINKIHKLYSIVVKDIITKDNLIHIHINYIYLPKINKSLKRRYNFLQQIKNNSIYILSNGKIEKKNDLKLKNKLSAIKEEDGSILNSKIYEEIDNIKNNYD